MAAALMSFRRRVHDMFNFKKQKQKTGSNSGDTWRQVFADLRNSLGISQSDRGKDQEEDHEDKVTSPPIESPPSEAQSSPLLYSDSLEVNEGQRDAATQDSSALEPGNITANEEHAEGKKPASRLRRLTRLSWRVKLLLGAGIIASVAVGIFREELFAPWPPSPNVVASFAGGQITLEDVEKHLASLVDDEKMQKQLKTPQGYVLIVEEMITDEIVRRWQANRKPDQDKEFSHVMKHITEEINLDELHAQMHKGQLGVTEGDIQAYYEANRKDFGEKTLTDVRDQIKSMLQNENEDAFVQNYITALKNKASIAKDLSVLNIPETPNWELKNYYDANKGQYVIKAQAVVQEIHIPKGGDEKKAKEKADQTLAVIRSGGDFASALKNVSDAGVPHEKETVTKGEGDPTYEETIFRLDPGAVSQVISASNDFIIAKLLSKSPERQQSFEEVRSKVRNAVLGETEKKYYTDNSTRTLFTLNGKQFTLGEFWEEYQELPVAFLTSYQGNEGKRSLVERIIERLLLYEDSTNQVSQTETKEKKDEMRLKVLAQMLEQEEIDDKIKIEDKDLQDYYDQNKAHLVKPPKSKVRQIAIKAGETEDDHKRAADKATEAYKRLVSGILKKGEEFSAVALAYSEDEETKNNGGEVAGWVEEEMNLLGEITTHAYHERVLSIPKGEIGEPFEANGYIYIVQVTDRTEAETISFEEAKEFIRERLLQEKHAELQGQLSSKLMKENDVTVYTRTLKKISKQAESQAAVK